MDSVRYSRQILFEPIGTTGQQALQDAHILVIGLGALGSQITEQCVRAGVGHLSIVDRDYVDYSNLQRQTLYHEQDAEQGLPKAVAAHQHLRAINPSVQIDAYIEDVSPAFLTQFKQVDVIIDATDNFDIRFIVNDFAYQQQIPWIYGACVGSYGLSYTFLPNETPCLHCLMQKIPLGGATCDTAGIIAPAVSQVVVWQMTELLKILTKQYDALRGTLISTDLWKNEIAEVRVQSLKDPACPCCSSHATHPYLQADNQLKTAILCGRDTVQLRMNQRENWSLDQFAETLQGQNYTQNDYLIRIEAKPYKLVVFQDGRVFVHGTKDVLTAKKLYYQYF